MSVKRMVSVRVFLLITLAAVAGGIFSFGCSDKSGAGKPGPVEEGGPTKPYYLFSAYDGNDYELYLMSIGATAAKPADTPQDPAGGDVKDTPPAAQDHEITQLTKNEVNDLFPAGAGDKLVWKCDNGKGLKLCATDMQEKSPKEVPLPEKTDFLDESDFFHGNTGKIFVSDILRGGFVRYDAEKDDTPIKKTAGDLLGKPDAKSPWFYTLGAMQNGTMLFEAGESDRDESGHYSDKKFVLLTPEGELKDISFDSFDGTYETTSYYNWFYNLKDRLFIVFAKNASSDPSKVTMDYHFYTIDPAAATAKQVNIPGMETVSYYLPCAYSEMNNSYISDSLKDGPYQYMPIVAGDVAGNVKLAIFDTQTGQFKTLIEQSFDSSAVSFSSDADENKRTYDFQYCDSNVDRTKVLTRFYDKEGKAFYLVMDVSTGAEKTASVSKEMFHIAHSDDMNLLVFSEYDLSHSKNGKTFVIADISKETSKVVAVGKAITQVRWLEKGRKLLIDASEDNGSGVTSVPSGAEKRFVFVYDVDEDKLSEISALEGFDSVFHVGNDSVVAFDRLTCPESEPYCWQGSDGAVFESKLYDIESGIIIDLPVNSKEMGGGSRIELTDAELAVWKGSSLDTALSASVPPVADSLPEPKWESYSPSIRKSGGVWSSSPMDIQSRKKDAVFTWTLVAGSTATDITQFATSKKNNNALRSSVFWPSISTIDLSQIGATILDTLVDEQKVTIKVSDGAGSAEKDVDVKIDTPPVVTLENFDGAQPYTSGAADYTCGNSSALDECSIIVNATGSDNLVLAVWGNSAVMSKCKCTADDCSTTECSSGSSSSASPAKWKIRFKDSKATGGYQIPVGNNPITIKVTDAKGNSSEKKLNIIGTDPVGTPPPAPTPTPAETPPVITTEAASHWGTVYAQPYDAESHEYICVNNSALQECSILVNATSDVAGELRFDVIGKSLANGTSDNEWLVLKSKCGYISADSCSTSGMSLPSMSAKWSIRFKDALSGTFGYLIPIGDNFIIIKVTDSHGNSSEFELNVKGTP